MKISIYVDWSENPIENFLVVDAAKITYEPGLLIIHPKDDGPESVFKRSRAEGGEIRSTYAVPVADIGKLFITDDPDFVVQAPESPQHGDKFPSLTSVQENLRYLASNRVIGNNLNGKLRAIAAEQKIDNWMSFLRNNTKSSLKEYRGITDKSIAVIEAIYRKNGLVLGD